MAWASRLAVGVGRKNRKESVDAIGFGLLDAFGCDHHLLTIIMDEPDSLVVRRSQRSTAGNRYECASDLVSKYKN